MKTKYQAFLAALVAILFVGTSAKAIDVRSEVNRKELNTTRLTKLHPYMQPKVAAVIRDLESHDLRPVIDAAVYRTPAEQAKLKARGVSTVSYSFHTVTDKVNGKSVPAALAADIVGYNEAWGVPNSFWLKLASSAKSHDLAPGIYWGLSTSNRSKIDSIIAKRDWNAKFSRGWDPAHIEVRGITLGQAQKGIRPVARNPPAVSKTK